MQGKKNSLDSRVLVSARRLRELKAAPKGTEIETIEPVEHTARYLAALRAADRSHWRPLMDIWQLRIEEALP